MINSNWGLQKSSANYTIKDGQSSASEKKHKEDKSYKLLNKYYRQRKKRRSNNTETGEEKWSQKNRKTEKKLINTVQVCCAQHLKYCERFGYNKDRLGYKKLINLSLALTSNRFHFY